MAFALMVNQLIPALKQPGCPICNLQRAAEERFLAAFLQENLMDQKARQKVLDSLGFCPAHTFQLAALELRSDGDTLGTNILHEQLINRLQQVLKGWRRKNSGGGGRSFFRGLNGGGQARLHPTEECPICAGMRDNNQRGLAALMDELGRNSQELVELVRQGDGLCLAHLRQGLETLGGEYPAGADFLVAEALNRLASQQERMREFIRKHNLSYQDEVISAEEYRAWREALSFFTGYAPDSFGPFNPRPD